MAIKNVTPTAASPKATFCMRVRRSWNTIKPNRILNSGHR